MLTAIIQPATCAKRNFKIVVMKHIKGKNQKTRNKLAVLTRRVCSH